MDKLYHYLENNYNKQNKSKEEIIEDLKIAIKQFYINKNMEKEITIYEITHLDGSIFRTDNFEIFNSYNNLLYDFKPWAIYKFKALYRTNKWWIVYCPLMSCASKFDKLYDALKELYCVTDILETNKFSWEEYKEQNPCLEQYGYKPLYILYLTLSFCKSIKRLFNYNLKLRIDILILDCSIFFTRKKYSVIKKYAQQLNNLFKLLKIDENEK